MFWSGRRVFLTGHTGFKGAWLSLWLQQLGAAVTGFSLAPPTQPSLFAEASVASGMTSLLADIRNLAGLRAAMQHSAPELVIHMAAQALVRPSYKDPAGTFATNVMGTVHLLDAARTCPSVRAILIVTSDKCYENAGQPQPFRETDPLGGHDPYSNSKACAELVTACYRSSFFPPASYPAHRVAVATARAGNVIGGGDYAPDRLLPDAVRAFSTGTPLRLRKPQATRPWQHVIDPLNGYLNLAQSLVEQGPRSGGAWNFGPCPTSIQTVEALISNFAASWTAHTRRPARWHAATGPHPHEAQTLSLDCSRANAELNWRPTLPFAEAIELCADWYARRQAGEDARMLCLEELARYTNRETAAKPSLRSLVLARPAASQAASTTPIQPA